MQPGGVAIVHGRETNIPSISTSTVKLNTDLPPSAAEPKPWLAGPILIWVGSLIFCIEYLVHAWPSGLYFMLVPIGVILATVAAIRHATWKPIVWGLAAAVPPLVALAANGFRI
jgi:hypothetical protein